uniref:Amidophosphoribosyltransferase n=1 Tax=Arundo donax TaxID=35708 RepID=A0A0A9E9K1_ARUDO
MCSKTHDLRGRCGTRHAEDTDMSRRSTTTTSPGSTSRS